MDTIYHKILANSKILHTFTEFSMFQYKQRSKKLVAEGNCLIVQSTSTSTAEPDIYLKMNNLQYIKKINNNLFARVRYENSTAFLFFHETSQHVVYAITTHNKSSYLPIFQQLLIQKAQLVDYESSAFKYEDKLRLDYHCEKIMENQVSVHHNTITKIGKTVGNFFGMIGNKITKTGSQIDSSFNNKIQTFSRQSLSNETRSKWSNFKQKASQFNDKLAELIKPISQLGSEVITKIGDSYQKSQNSVIKSIRKLTKQTEKSLNQGYITQIQQQKNVPDKMNQTIQPINQGQKVLDANEQKAENK